MIQTQTQIDNIQPQRPGAPRTTTGDDFEGHSFKFTKVKPRSDWFAVGSRLIRKLDTHRWHVLRYNPDDPYTEEPDDDNPPETYEAVAAANTITPNAIKKLVAGTYCVRQIMWPNRQIGICIEVWRGHYYLATPGIKYVSRDPANRKISLGK